MAEERFAVTDCDGHIFESIPEMAERADLTREEKQAVLGANAKRFFKL